MTNMVPSTRRYPTLDLLRLIAIAFTMMAHTPSLTHRIFFLAPFSNCFWLGVDLFMLISGWLLGGQLLREITRGTVRPFRFYMKRWLRTLPPYYAMLLILYFGRGPQFSAPLPFGVVLSHFLFFQQYAGRNEFGVSWSLCVEEHFYLVLPVIVIFLLRGAGILRVVLLVMGAEALSIMCRAMSYSVNMDVPYLSHLRCHGLFVGLLFAWISIHNERLWVRMGRVATIAACVGLVSTLWIMSSVPQEHSRWTFVWVPTFGTWTLALIFLACVHEASAFSRVSFKGLRYLGELTYSMYLVHDVIPREWFGVSHAGESGLRGIVIRIGLVLGLSMLLHHAIEWPALRLRERLLRGGRRPSDLVRNPTPS
jgi:peptidoglycan/LPS O-acetylase OafA/YrhL